MGKEAEERLNLGNDESERTQAAATAPRRPGHPQRVNTHPLDGGRPPVPDRTCANGICYVLRTGCQWKSLDATDICSGSTAHLRFQEGAAAGCSWSYGGPGWNAMTN